MRTIKFRAKTTHGYWGYGSLLIWPDGKAMLYDTLLPDGSMGGVVVDPDTVGQFTGFYDKDEREIYDGDVFQVNGGPYHLIKWLDELGGFGTCNLVSIRMLKDWPDRCLFGIPGSGWWHDFGREIVVVGNIHDNPDFLDKFKEK